MKKYIIYGIILLLTISCITGCGTSPQISSQKYGEEYLKTLYTFHDTDKIIDQHAYSEMVDLFVEKFKVYMTDTGYFNFRAMREGLPTVNVALKNKCNIDIDNIEMKLVDSQSKGNTYFYNFTVNVRLTYLSGGELRNTKVEGEISITKIGDDWKVERLTTTGAKDWTDLLL